MECRVDGTEFHIAGPDTEKARANCVLTRWMMAALAVDNRSLCQWIMFGVNVNRSTR